MLSDILKSADIEDTLLLKQNWPVMAKKRRNAPTIFGAVRPFTVRQESGECDEYEEDMLRDKRPRKHGSIPSRKLLFTKTSITTPRARTNAQLTGNRGYISQCVKLTTAGKVNNPRSYIVPSYDTRNLVETQNW